MAVFRPPAVRSGANALNRALFSRRVNIAAAAVNDCRLISKYRKALADSRELLHAERISPIAPHPDRALADKGYRCFLLHPDVQPQGLSLISPLSFPFIIGTILPTFAPPC